VNHVSFVIGFSKKCTGSNKHTRKYTHATCTKHTTAGQKSHADGSVFIAKCKGFVLRKPGLQVEYLISFKSGSSSPKCVLTLSGVRSARRECGSSLIGWDACHVSQYVTWHAS
jgi:hypothetical protein